MPEQDTAAAAAPARIASGVPAILIAGSLREDRLSLIGALIAARPDNEPWAVVGNGLLPPMPPGPDLGRSVVFESVPAGCACCAGALPFRVGLTRLLRRLAGTPPKRLIIEAGDGTHVANLRAQLVGSGFAALLDLRCVVATLDGALAQTGSSAARRAVSDLASGADYLVLDPRCQADSPAVAAMPGLAAGLDSPARPISGMPDTEGMRMILAHRHAPQ